MTILYIVYIVGFILCVIFLPLLESEAEIKERVIMAQMQDVQPPDEKITWNLGFYTFFLSLVWPFIFFIVSVAILLLPGVVYFQKLIK